MDRGKVHLEKPHTRTFFNDKKHETIENVSDTIDMSQMSEMSDVKQPIRPDNVVPLKPTTNPMSSFALSSEAFDIELLEGESEVEEEAFGEYGEEEIQRVNEECGEEEEQKYSEEFVEVLLDQKTPQSFLRGVEFGPKYHPFKLKWVFGASVDVKIVNLCNTEQKCVAFAAGQALIIYNMSTKSMEILEGHQCTLSDLSTDQTGRFLVSADRGIGSSIIVWDTTTTSPIYTVFDPYPKVEKESTQESEHSEDWDGDEVQYGTNAFIVEDYPDAEGICKIAISPNAKYIVSVAYKAPIVKFWLWTYGNDTADAEYAIPPPLFGECTGIAFNPNCQEQIMLCFEKAVFFTQWDTENNAFEEFLKMDIRTRAKFGPIVGCTYVENCHESFAIAEKGAVHVFGTIMYSVPYESVTSDPKKTVYIKTVLISTTAVMTDILSVDGMLVMGDSLGRISIYDHSLLILYWLQDLRFPGIASVRFNLNKKEVRIEDPTHFHDKMFVLESPKKILEGDVEDISNQVEILFTNTVPKDITLQRRPFTIRDFVVLSADSSIFSVNSNKRIINLEYESTKDVVTALTTHNDSPYLVVAYESGLICLFNYETLEKITCHTLPEAIIEETQERVLTTALRYSPDSYRLACGRSNGEVWLLEPILQVNMYEVPFLVTNNSVVKIVFSSDSNYCAYFDNNRTVILIRYSHFHNEWRINGKYRSHCAPITDIMFSPYVNHKFFTISEDRYLIEYNAKKSTDEEICISKREIIEQSAIPLCFAFLPKREGEPKQLLLYSDDQFKYKLINEDNFYQRGTFIGPAYGCYTENPVNRIFMTAKYKDHFIFTTDKHIGIQRLPLTGNPYQLLGMYGHPVKLSQVCLTYDGEFLFTVGENDSSILMWKVNYSSVDNLMEIGGKDLEPFYCLIEGGPTGWLFKEMQDLFYYMQVLHQDESSVAQRYVSDKIPIVELPDLMRACGFYPTEFEVRALLADIRQRSSNSVDGKRSECSFIEFVQLYLNHRPVHGMSMQKLEEVFDKFVDTAGGSYGTMDKNQFLDTICLKGETISLNNLYKCLSVLTNNDRVSDEIKDEFEFDFLPDNMGFDELVEVLGINTDEQEQEAFEARQVND